MLQSERTQNHLYTCLSQIIFIIVNFVHTSDRISIHPRGKTKRLVNDLVIVLLLLQHQFSTYQYMTFEMVSLIPFEPNLIDFSLLTPRQVSF